MNDAENENDAVALEDVVHDTEVPYAKSVKGVGGALEGFRLLPTDPARGCDLGGQALQGGSTTVAILLRELPKGSRGGGGELDPVRLGQSRSFKLVVFPVRNASRP